MKFLIDERASPASLDEHLESQFWLIFLDSLRTQRVEIESLILLEKLMFMC